MNDLISRLRSRLARVASGDISLAAFEDWYVPLLSESEDHADDAAPDYLYEIHLLLAEYSAGDLSARELYARFEALTRESTGSLSRTSGTIPQAGSNLIVDALKRVPFLRGPNGCTPPGNR